MVSKTSSVFLSFRCFEDVFYTMQSYTCGTAPSAFSQLDLFLSFPTSFCLFNSDSQKFMLFIAQVPFSLFVLFFFFKFIYI